MDWEYISENDRKRRVVNETIYTLRELEQRHRGGSQWIRVRALLILKERPDMSLGEVARWVGCSERSMQRWWNSYTHRGIEVMLRHGNRKEGNTKLGPDELKALRTRMEREGFASLHEAREWVRENFGVAYSISGIWNLLRNKMDDGLGRKRIWKLEADGGDGPVSGDDRPGGSRYNRYGGGPTEVATRVYGTDYEYQGYTGISTAPREVEAELV